MLLIKKEKKLNPDQIWVTLISPTTSNLWVWFRTSRPRPHLSCLPPSAGPGLVVQHVEEAVLTPRPQVTEAPEVVQGLQTFIVQSDQTVKGDRVHCWGWSVLYQNLHFPRHLWYYEKYMFGSWHSAPKALGLLWVIGSLLFLTLSSI